MAATRLSRYEFAPVEVDDQNRTFLDVPNPIPRVLRSDDLRTITGEGETLRHVAWRAYRDLNDPDEEDLRPTSFWDVIAEVNLLIDAVPVLEGDTKIPTGTVLRIPNTENLLGEIRVPPAFYERSTVV